MSEPFIGEIIMFGGNFAPRGWAFCDGQLLAISSNTALFSILGTTYGGDGKTTFALPDLRGRVAIHPGAGAGLSRYTLGEKGGAESVTLTTNNLPSHSHTLEASTSPGTSNSPTSNVLGSYGTSAPPSGPYVSGSANTTMGTSVGNTGGNQSVGIVQPYLSVNFIIAITGIYPSRS